MPKPTHRVTISRKDGEDITYPNYKGESVTRKYCPIGALFPSKIEGGFSLVLERKVTLDPEVVWVNVYPQEERGADREPREREAGGKPPRARVRTGGPKAAPADGALFDESADLPD
ncbi:MAG TPA: hypothetical protein VNM37_21555 [Candidatus Dormibacteraeota bacterium]|nr:hypothetical protein [Candidatus Dormibacteraeota bacterium]